MKKLDLIIFDLGRVLVDFDFKKVVRDLKQHSSKSEAEIRQFFATTPMWDAFERGTITPQVFFKTLVKELELEGLTFKSFQPLWNEIFREMPESIDILARLRGRYRLAMISNVNQMHWEHIRGKHSFMKWFELPIASYAVGHRKPEAEIYHLTLRKAKVDPARAMFIDDVEAHIVAARDLGIHGHHFKGAKGLAKEIKELLE